MAFSEAFTRHFNIERSLGKGAMGEVFLARDQERGGQVAIKVVLDSMFGDDDARLRFLREAKITSVLSHPNIIRVIDQGRDEGRLFIAFEYVEGGSLGARLRERGPLTPEEFFTVAVGILDAMVYAHRQGVLHRDLKADNVLLDREGQPRIADFGLAKGVDNAGLETVAGTLMGTPTYMAPELAKGQKASPATDQYAFGVLLYQMLCAKPPLFADNPMELLQKHIEVNPPLVTVHRPEVPRALAEAVHRALAKTPERRWPDLSALRDFVNVMALTQGKEWVVKPWDQQPALPPLGPVAPPVTAPIMMSSQAAPVAPPPAPVAASRPPPAPSQAAPDTSRRPLMIAIGAVVVLNLTLFLLQKRKPPQPVVSPSAAVAPVASVASVASVAPPAPVPSIAADTPLTALIGKLNAPVPGPEVGPVLELTARKFGEADWKTRALIVKLAHALANQEAMALAAGRAQPIPALRFLAGLAPGPLTGLRDARFMGPTGQPLEYPPALDGPGDFRRASWCTRPVAPADEAEAKAVLEAGARTLPARTPAPPQVRLVVEIAKASMPGHVDVSFGTEVVICHRIPHGMGAKPHEEIENVIFSTVLDTEAVKAAGGQEPAIGIDCGGRPCPKIGRVGLAYVEPRR